jgi:predicted MFS family arabinose efflux permease
LQFFFKSNLMLSTISSSSVPRPLGSAISTCWNWSWNCFSSQIVSIIQSFSNVLSFPKEPAL